MNIEQRGCGFSRCWRFLEGEEQQFVKHTVLSRAGALVLECRDNYTIIAFESGLVSSKTQDVELEICTRLRSVVCLVGPIPVACAHLFRRSRMKIDWLTARLTLLLLCCTGGWRACRSSMFERL